MNWYYAIDREKQGPITETEFNALVESGTITDATLVWNETITDWTPFEEIKPKEGEPKATDSPQPEKAAAPKVAAKKTAGQKTCSECGKSFPEDELAKFKDDLVCASCKPAFLQKIREGVSMGAMVYAGFWIRLGAKIIDGIIIAIVNFVINLAFGAMIIPTVTDPEDFQAVMIPVIIMSFLQWAVSFTYTTWFVGKFAATPGKMVCGLKVVTAEGEKVTYLRAFARCLGELLSSIIFLIGYIMAAFDSEKRTLHDRICSTRVIKNR